MGTGPGMDSPGLLASCHCGGAPSRDRDSVHNSELAGPAVTRHGRPARLRPALWPR
jgi:hypothetical protein